MPRVDITNLIAEQYRVDGITGEGKLIIRHWFSCDMESTMITEANSLRAFVEVVTEHERKEHSRGKRK